MKSFGTFYSYKSGQNETRDEKLYVVMAFGIYAVVSLYLGMKFQELWPHGRRNQKRPVYWIIVWCSIGLVFLQRSFGIGCLIYLVMLYVGADVVCILIHRLRLHRCLIGWLVICIASAISVYGFVNANRIVITSYQVSLSRGEMTDSEDTARLLMISDVHLGTAVTLSDLSEFVLRANDVKADLICICGDLYDERTTKEEIEASYAILGQLKARFGVFYVEGNHEVSIDSYDLVIHGLKEQGIIVLLDQTVMVNNQFILAGRKDVSNRISGDERKPLSELLNGIDPDCGIIVLDHQPRELKEASLLGVDLVLSGHTHAGQIFPANFFSAALNEQNYGKKMYGSMASITSSGLGTWGFVLRTCRHCEMVVIQLAQ